jgi:subtilisin family serine protease
MSIARTAEGSRTGPAFRFGIRWDDGRRPPRLLRAAVLALIALALAGPVAAQARPTPIAGTRVDVVVVAAADRRDAAQRLVERVGGTVRERLDVVNGFSASVPRRSLRRLAASASIRAVTPDQRGIRVLSTDPGAAAAAASTQVIRTATGLTGPTASRLDGAGVDVALIDSGAMPLGGLERPGALVRGPDLTPERHDPDLAQQDSFGHGTHLAGVIAGHDPLNGFQGVAPGVRVVSVKVADHDGMTSLARVLMALDWVRRHRNADGFNMRVLNMSLGLEQGDYRRHVLTWAAEELWSEGIVVVAAAGNSDTGDGLDLPAADPYVLAVAASDTRGTPDPADDGVADFSSRDRRRPPDLAAPGTQIVSLRVPGSTLDTEFPGARIGDGYFRGSGTSQAAAVTSGLAALLIGQRPELNPDQVKALLVGGAVDLPDPAESDGAGRVDLERSAAAPTPDAAAVAQTWPRAEIDKWTKRLIKKYGELGDDELDQLWDRVIVAGEVLWNGRRWSGRRWSGRRWSGRRWSGMKWSGAAWIGDATG